MNILVTGGAGYVGSHAAQDLVRRGHRVLIVDNLERGHAAAVDRLRESVEPSERDRLGFVRADTGDRAAMERILREHSVEAVMHFAALALVGESVTRPLLYHENNTAGTVRLLQACEAAGVTRFVFSSTCATYGEPAIVPIPEDCPQSPINPYGWSKLHVERALLDFAAAREAAGEPFAFAALRYFNVAGADPTGVLGEWHKPETHLIPIVLQVALGQREKITVFGSDYPTPDGTCVRDYIHVSDLVEAHAVALEALEPGDRRFYNLGTGEGVSVRQIIESARRVTGSPIPEADGPRRPGDPPRLYADPRKIMEDLGWSARITDLDEIVRTAYDWFRANPHGYDG